MSDRLQIFRDEFLNANSWAERKDGVPLDLLDDLSVEELILAEKELINILSTKDDWPIMGLGHIKSQNSLTKLYDLIPESKKGMKITIAHSIYQICEDTEMIEIVLTEIPKISDQYELIHIVYLLAGFENQKVDEVLNSLRQHKEYIVAYNATQAMGLSTQKVVAKFRKKDAENSVDLWSKIKAFFN